MDALISMWTVILSMALGASSQYSSSGYGSPPAAILMHKQALGQDGSFNYAFSADNGLQQGESINPDGSRTGSYSYVDPNGKTVSLRYTAGKDGFRVLEGDHVPRPPPQQAHPTSDFRPNNPSYEGAYRSGPSYDAPYRGAAPSYRPPLLPFRRPHYSVDEGGEGTSGFEQQYRAAPFTHGLDEEPYTGPHTFGNGFSFEFAGK